MKIRMNLLAITVALCVSSTFARAEDLEIPGSMSALTYQDQLVACSYFFGEKARTEAAFDDNVEIRKIAVRNFLRNMHKVLVPQNEVIPGPRSRAAQEVGETAARSTAGADVMNTYCFHAVMAGTAWLSKEAQAQIEQQVEYDYVHMRPPFRR